MLLSQYYLLVIMVNISKCNYSHLKIKKIYRLLIYSFSTFPTNSTHNYMLEINLKTVLFQ